MGSYFGNKFLLYISFLFISYLHWKVGLTQNLLLSSLFDLILNMSNSSVSFSPISSIAIPKHNIRVFVNQNYLQNASFSLLLFSILLYNSTHFIFFFFFMYLLFTGTHHFKKIYIFHPTKQVYFFIFLLFSVFSHFLLLFFTISFQPNTI